MYAKWQLKRGQGKVKLDGRNSEESPDLREHLLIQFVRW